MILEEARHWAAQAWCDPSTENRTMDPPLAEAFAKILEQRVNEAVQSAAIFSARSVMRTALENDPGFKEAYVSNVAMLLHDKYGITDSETRNAAAADILKLIFGR